jgi:sugar/nucleoside kinase (ribokinase family)
MAALPSRNDICQSTSHKLAEARSRLPKLKAVIGLDGFVDEIIAVVDKRRNLDDFDRVRTIEQIGKKILAAAGQSSNYELVVKQTKLGGNGPIMANALAAAGMDITYVGILGYPSIHPVFEEFARRARRVISLAEPGHTDALEFDDGKLMFGKHASLREVTWDNLVERAGGIDQLTKDIAAASLVGIVNWTMLPHLSDIWSKLASAVLPRLPKAQRYFFVDLCDPEKRTAEDLCAAMHILSSMQGMVDVVLGLNLKEAMQVAQVLDLPKFVDDDVAIQGAAASIREKMKIGCVVIHPRRGAAAATADGRSAWFAGPFVKEPKISTGAGDHFNAGFCLGRVLGFTLEESLCTGVATSGYYVRTAISPTAQHLAEFTANLPQPQA